MRHSMLRSIEIPNKSSFKISEVAAITGIKTYVLRFWESEFLEIAPILSSSGQKLYERRDIETILLIKKMLFVDKLSIDNAKIELQKIMNEENSISLDFVEQVGITTDLEKLVLAKEKLIEILRITESLQSKNEWH